jgi:hypothetical protein
VRNIVKSLYHRSISLATGLMLLAGTFAGAPVIAATQGSWGTTSTATVNITLRILPEGRDSEAALSPAAAGRDVLHRFCASSSAFEDSSQFFTASVMREPRGPAEVDELLRASCDGRSPAGAATNAASNFDQDQFTLLIAPI